MLSKLRNMFWGLTNSGNSEQKPAKNSEFYCPLSLKIMAEPVTTSCGHIFEKEKIEAYYFMFASCPVCHQITSSHNKISLTPNNTLKAAISKALEKNPALYKDYYCSERIIAELLVTHPKKLDVLLMHKEFQDLEDLDIIFFPSSFLPNQNNAVSNTVISASSSSSTSTQSTASVEEKNAKNHPKIMFVLVQSLHINSSGKEEKKHHYYYDPKILNQITMEDLVGVAPSGFYQHLSAFFRLCKYEAGANILIDYLTPLLTSLNKEKNYAIEKKALNAIVPEGRYKGLSTLFWLSMHPKGREFLTNNTSMIEKTALNTVVSEEPFTGLSALFWLCQSPEGRGFLANNTDMIEKTALNTVVPAELFKGQSALFWLSITQASLQFLLENSSMIDSVTLNMMDASGASALFFFAIDPNGCAWLRRQSEKETLIEPKTLNHIITEGDGKGTSAALWLASHQDGIILLSEKLRDKLDPQMLEAKIPSGKYQGLSLVAALEQYEKEVQEKNACASLDYSKLNNEVGAIKQAINNRIDIASRQNKSSQALEVSIQQLKKLKNEIEAEQKKFHSENITSDFILNYEKQVKAWQRQSDLLKKKFDEAYNQLDSSHPSTTYAHSKFSSSSSNSTEVKAKKKKTKKKNNQTQVNTKAKTKTQAKKTSTLATETKSKKNQGLVPLPTLEELARQRKDKPLPQAATDDRHQASYLSKPSDTVDSLTKAVDSSNQNHTSTQAHSTQSQPEPEGKEQKSNRNSENSSGIENLTVDIPTELTLGSEEIQTHRGQVIPPLRYCSTILSAIGQSQQTLASRIVAHYALLYGCACLLEALKQTDIIPLKSAQNMRNNFWLWDSEILIPKITTEDNPQNQKAILESLSILQHLVHPLCKYVLASLIHRTRMSGKETLSEELTAGCPKQLAPRVQGIVEKLSHQGSLEATQERFRERRNKLSKLQALGHWMSVYHSTIPQNESDLLLEAANNYYEGRLDKAILLSEDEHKTAAASRHRTEGHSMLFSSNSSSSSSSITSRSSSSSSSSSANSGSSSTLKFNSNPS